MSQEPMLYNVHVRMEGNRYNSEWMDGTTYSEVLCKCLMKYPDKSKHGFIIEGPYGTWDAFIKDTKRGRFE